MELEPLRKQAEYRGDSLERLGASLGSTERKRSRHPDLEIICIEFRDRFRIGARQRVEEGAGEFLVSFFETTHSVSLHVGASSTSPVLQA